MPQLEPLGHLRGHPEDDPEVARDRFAAHRDGRGVGDRAVVEHRKIGRVAADVQEGDPELAVLVGEDRLGRRERGQDELVDLDARALDALREVLDAGLGGRDDVRLDLEPHGAHADRVTHALLPIHDVAARDHVEDLARIRDGYGPRRVDRPEGVLARDVPVMPGDGHHPARVLRADVVPGDADERGTDLEPRVALGCLDGARHGLDRAVDVDHDALAQAVGRRLAEADDVDAAVAGDLADEDADLRRTDVDGDQDGLLRH